MTGIRLASYVLFVAAAAVVIFWLSITPLAGPIALAVAPACMARAIVPLSWIPWLRAKAVQR